MEDDLEWVALMQHHGCLTSIAGLARSYWQHYIAGRDSNEQWLLRGVGCNSVKRATNAQFSCTPTSRSWTSKGITPQQNEDLSERNVAGKLSSASLFRRAFLSNKFSLVCTVQPVRHNERMASQQGCFLCLGDLSTQNGFEINLLTQLTLGKDPEYFFPCLEPASGF